MMDGGRLKYTTATERLGWFPATIFSHANLLCMPHHNVNDVWVFGMAIFPEVVYDTEFGNFIFGEKEWIHVLFFTPFFFIVTNDFCIHLVLLYCFAPS